MNALESSSSDHDPGAGAGAGTGTGSGRELVYSGWVYHLGVNSIGYEYCHLRFLVLRGNYVAMYKRDPHDNPGINPIRKGVISHNLMVKELGRRKVNDGDVYVLRLYNRLDETKKGEIACASAGEAHKWIEAFDHAKQQAESDLLRGNNRHRLNIETELNLEGHRPRVRRYAHGLRKLIRIGKGPEMLLRKSSEVGRNMQRNTNYEGDVGDAIEAHEWRCIHTLHGNRVFEDVSNRKAGKGILLKTVGVIDADVDTIFEIVLSLDKHMRYEWDTLTGDLEVVDSVDGHYDVVYGTFDPKWKHWWHSKKDFVFSRQWFRGQDGAYTILQFPVVHKKQPPRSGYQRIKINPSIWEIRRLNSSLSPIEKSLVTQILEIQCSSWDKWKRHYNADFGRSIPYALLCQVAGLREFFRANPSLTFDAPSTIVSPSSSYDSSAHTGFEDSEVQDEFYDAIANDNSLEDEDSDDDIEPPKAGKVTLKNVSWAIASLALKRTPDSAENAEFEANVPPISINLRQFNGSLHLGKNETDSNCWSSPSGQGFMIRGKNYLKDSSKVVGGNPLLKLIAVDWFKAENGIEKVALHPNCLVQSEAGRKLPFILVINLEIPAKPNYSLVLYYGAERPIKKESLLGRFIDGTDVFRDARFKLIPSIIEGYWMVKRAVGTKACLLGKAVTCRYLRQDNFLEIDVDIGSSSVAKSIVGLVLGYVTNIVVDLAILVEAKEVDELPEYILGTVRLNRVRLDAAVPFS